MFISQGIDLPLLDMAKRYGVNNSPEISLDYIHQERFFFGAHIKMIIGGTVKEDVISNLRNKDGGLISKQKYDAIITMKERGFMYGVHAGYFLNLSKSNSAHGIRFRFGTGLMSHYIRFNDESASSNQLLGDYSKGYDRLTRGYFLQEFIGYQYTSASKKLNLFVGFDCIQGFTKNVRPYNFDTRMTDNAARKDLLIGIRAGIALNLYRFENTEKEIFY